MKFVYPEFLYALFALLIPVIVHLFNFRRFKKIDFSNVKFLEEVQLETQSKSRLKHLLVLFSRLLALASLVLAFCLPFIPVEDNQVIAGRKALSIYVDNSFSMNGENEGGLLLEQAKEMAREVAKSYDESDRFQLLTNDFEGRHQRLVSREEFVEYVDEVEQSAKVKDMSQIVERMKEALGREDIQNKRGFILSDFQSSVCDFDNIKNDTNYFFNLLPIQQSDAANVYIDSVWFKVPVRQLNNNEEMRVKLVNQSERTLNNLGIKLSVNGAQKALATVNIPANSSAITDLFFTNDKAGIMDGKVSITDHPITFDDQFYFSYDVTDKINILRIGGSNGAVKSVFTGDEFFNFQTTTVSNVDYSLLKNLDLVVLDGIQKISSGLNQELKKFAELGGSVILLPGASSDVPTYNEFLLNMSANRIFNFSEKATKVSSIDTENNFFDGVFEQIPSNIDLPIVKKHLQFNARSQSREEKLLSLQNGNSFLSKYPVGNGQFFVYAVGTSSEMSNLSRHAIFVTSLLRIAELSAGKQDLYQIIGENKAINVKSISTSNESSFHITKKETGFDVIPSYQNHGGGVEVFVHEQIDKDGIYKLSLNEENITGLAFNYSRQESNMRFENQETLSENIQSSGLNNFKIINVEQGDNVALNTLTEGTKLWKWFVIFALFFLLVEVLLLRFL